MHGDRVVPCIYSVLDADYSALDFPFGHYKFTGYFVPDIYRVFDSDYSEHDSNLGHFKVKFSDEYDCLSVCHGSDSRNIYVVLDSDYSDRDTDFGHHKFTDGIVLGGFFLACDFVIALVGITSGNHGINGGNERNIFLERNGYFVLDIYFVFDSDYSDDADGESGDDYTFDFGYYKLFRPGSRVLPRSEREAGQVVGLGHPDHLRRDDDLLVLGKQRRGAAERSVHDTDARHQDRRVSTSRPAVGPDAR